MPLLTVHEVKARLREACKATGGQKAWASQNGVSNAYVSDVLNGRREPWNLVLFSLGLRQERLYAASADAWHPEDLYDATRLGGEDF